MKARKQMPSFLLLAFVFLTLGFVIADGAPCVNVNVTGSHNDGAFNISSNHTDMTCFQFMIRDVTNSRGGAEVYFSVRPDLIPGVESVTVSSVSGGNLTEISHRTYNLTTSQPVPYLVITKAAAGNATVEVLRLVVNFKAPNGTEATGIASYTNESCSLTYDDAVPPVLQAPDYLVNASPTVAQCQYIFSLPESAAAHSFSFTEFNVVSGSSVSFHSPTAGTVLENFNGAVIPPDCIVENKTKIMMYINLTAAMKFSAIATESSKECTGYNLLTNGSTIQVTSPGYPNKNYTNNLDCRFILFSNQSDMFVQLVAASLSLSPDADSISLIDGAALSQQSTKLIAYLSNMDLARHQESVYLSSGPFVMLRFKSDQFGTAKGFEFNVSVDATSRLYYAGSDIKFAPKTGDPGHAMMAIKGHPNHVIVEITPNVTGSAMQLSPDATVKCYDGDTTYAQLIAYYSTDLLMYPAYTSRDRALCVASGLSVNTDVFSATTRALPSSTPQLNKNSFGSADSYSQELPIVATANQTYNWVIQPEGFNKSVVELVVNQLGFPSDANVSVGVHNLKGLLYTTLTKDTVLPFMIRGSVEFGLRLSVSHTAVNTTATFSTMSLSATYTLDNKEAELTGQSGAIQSPHYPRSTPARTDKRWRVSVPANQSLQLSFEGGFELSNTSYLRVTGSNNRTYLNVTGPLMKAPSDVILNNTSTNESMSVTISLMTYNQTSVTGVKIYYKILDGGYVTPIISGDIVIHTPGYPQALNKSYSATWVLSVPHNDSKGVLQQAKAVVTFTPNNATKLEFRDGPSASSPLLVGSQTLTSSVAAGSTLTVTSSSNSIYMTYTYIRPAPVANKTVMMGSPFSATIMTKGCASGVQCLIETNETVCMPQFWKCDGIYQCMDGKDEDGCKAAPTAGPKPVTKEGAKWWVVALCILAGFVLGIILTTIIILSIMRRRGAGYNRLSELMTPVPT